jgi:hybrid cluster-associated redox disulfide protein
VVELITKDTPIIEALRSHPQARAIFTKYGLGCTGCMGSSTETISNGAKMHAVNVDKLLRELNALEPKK